MHTSAILTCVVVNILCGEWGVSILCGGWGVSILCGGWGASILCGGWGVSILCGGWGVSTFCVSIITRWHLLVAQPIIRTGKRGE